MRACTVGTAVAVALAAGWLALAPVPELLVAGVAVAAVPLAVAVVVLALVVAGVVAVVALLAAATVAEATSVAALLECAALALWTAIRPKTVLESSTVPAAVVWSQRRMRLGLRL